MFPDRLFFRIVPLTCLSLISSCAYMSQTGPQKSAIEGGKQDFELIEVKSRADIPSANRHFGSGEIPSPVKGSSYSDKVRSRDALHFVITDPFDQSPFYTRGEPYDLGPIEVPEDGIISIPYVGELQVIGRSLSHISTELNEKLKPISKTGRATVGRSARIARTANVIGEVKSPGPVQLEKSNLTSLDLLASSGGPVEKEHLFKYTLRRDGRDYVFDYLGFRQKAFPVEEGDLLSVTTDVSNRFYVLGAINRPTIVPFPVPAPTLADALGAATGLNMQTSDPSGVFVFRKGNPDRVFTVNLKEPGAMFITQRFPIVGEDLVYVTEAPLARWSRLVNQLLPFTQFSQVAYNLDRINQ